MVKNNKNVAMVVMFLGGIGSIYGANIQTVRDLAGNSIKIKLPFAYQCLSTKKGGVLGKPLSNLRHTDGHVFDDSTVFVTESFYAVLGKGLKTQSAVVGPLCPCILIAIRSESQDRAVIFHYCDKNNMDGIKKVIAKELGSDLNSDDLRLSCFSCGDAETLKLVGSSVETREKNYKNLVDDLCSYYQIKKQNVKSIFYTEECTYSGLLYGTERIVFVNSKLRTFNTSFANEELFGPIRTERDVGFYLEGTGYDNCLAFSHRSFSEESDLIENPNKKLLPFFRFPDAQAGLKWLPLIASGYVKDINEFEELSKKEFFLTELGKELFEVYKPKP